MNTSPTFAIEFRHGWLHASASARRSALTQFNPCKPCNMVTNFWCYLVLFGAVWRYLVLNCYCYFLLYQRLKSALHPTFSGLATVISREASSALDCPST